jgi:hypothetical protein
MKESTGTHAFLGELREEAFKQERGEKMKLESDIVAWIKDKKNWSYEKDFDGFKCEMNRDLGHIKEEMIRRLLKEHLEKHVLSFRKLRQGFEVRLKSDQEVMAEEASFGVMKFLLLLIFFAVVVAVANRFLPLLIKSKTDTQ